MKRKVSSIAVPGFTKFYQEYPIVLVDVGASGGLQPNWEAARPYLKIIGFEPDENEFRALERATLDSAVYLNTALFSEKTKLTLNVTRKQQTSSVYPPNRQILDRYPESERFDLVDAIQVNADTLDSQFHKNRITDADFIKIDTQGSELDILRGATRVLHDCNLFGAEIEVEFVEMYTGQPMFHEVEKFMREQGFEIFDLQMHHWKRAAGRELGKARGQLVFANALYLRDISVYLGSLLNRGQDRAALPKILKAVSICVLYGYVDYACALLEHASQRITEAEFAMISTWLKKKTNPFHGLPNFRGRVRLANFFFTLYQILKPTHNGWGTVERELGNL